MAPGTESQRRDCRRAHRLPRASRVGPSSGLDFLIFSAATFAPLHNEQARDRDAQGEDEEKSASDSDANDAAQREQRARLRRGWGGSGRDDYRRADVGRVSHRAAAKGLWVRGDKRAQPRRAGRRDVSAECWRSRGPAVSPQQDDDSDCHEALGGVRRRRCAALLKHARHRSNELGLQAVKRSRAVVDKDVEPPPKGVGILPDGRVAPVHE